MEYYYYRYSLHNLIPDPGFVIEFSELFQGINQPDFSSAQLVLFPFCTECTLV